MGIPTYPSPAQVEQLWQVAQILPSEKTRVIENVLTGDLPPLGLAIVEVSASK
jgi:hypothetical protein